MINFKSDENKTFIRHVDLIRTEKGSAPSWRFVEWEVVDRSTNYHIINDVIEIGRQLGDSNLYLSYARMREWVKNKIKLPTPGQVEWAIRKCGSADFDGEDLCAKDTIEFPYDAPYSIVVAENGIWRHKWSGDDWDWWHAGRQLRDGLWWKIPRAKSTPAHLVCDIDTMRMAPEDGPL